MTHMYPNWMTGTERVTLKVLGKQRDLRKCQGWAGPLGVLGHLRHQESSMEQLQGSPSCSATGLTWGNVEASWQGQWSQELCVVCAKGESGEQIRSESWLWGEGIGGSQGRSRGQEETPSVSRARKGEGWLGVQGRLQATRSEKLVGAGRRGRVTPA